MRRIPQKANGPEKGQQTRHIDAQAAGAYVPATMTNHREQQTGLRL
jgi:hypothetical protein